MGQAYDFDSLQWEGEIGKVSPDFTMASPCLLAMLLAKSGKSLGFGDRVPGSSIKLLCCRSARDRQNRPCCTSNVNAPVLLASGLGDPGLPPVLFLLCGFRLFGILLPIPFGLVLLAFLVAHGWLLSKTIQSTYLWSQKRVDCPLIKPCFHSPDEDTTIPQEWQPFR